jgi:hypothetical protein
MKNFTKFFEKTPTHISETYISQQRAPLVESLLPLILSSLSSRHDFP